MAVLNPTVGIAWGVGVLVLIGLGLFVVVVVIWGVRVPDVGVIDLQVAFHLGSERSRILVDFRANFPYVVIGVLKDTSRISIGKL